MAVLGSMWDLDSSTSKVWSLNHWTFRKIPQIFFKANDGFKEYASQTLCSQLFFLKKNRICIGRGTKELCLGSTIFRFASYDLWKQLLVHRNKSPSRRPHAISKRISLCQLTHSLSFPLLLPQSFLFFIWFLYLF